jgi:hypothetical protein
VGPDPGRVRGPNQDALARVIADIAEPGAAQVDAQGSFPRKQADALTEAGICGLPLGDVG